MPKQKYPSYKPTHIDWIGEIPEHWEVIRSRFIMTYKKWKNAKVSSSIKKNNLFLPYLSMDFLRWKKEINIEYVENKKDLVEVKDNDLLLLRDGSNAWEYIKWKNGILSSTMAKISVSEEYDSQYIYYLSKFFENILKDFSIWMGIPHVNWSILKDLTFFKFDFTEQQKIADYLDRKTSLIEETITTKERQISLLQEKRTALINHVVTKGLDPDVEMVDSGIEWIGKIPKGWEVKRLKRDYRLITKKTTEWNKIWLENIEGFSGRIIKTSSDFEWDGILFKKDDILFGKLRPYLTKVGLAKDQWSAVWDIFVLRSMENISKFWQYMLLSNRFINVCNGSTFWAKMPRVSRDFMGSLFLPKPPIREQQAIVEYLDRETNHIDQTITTVQQSIELLKEYKQSLISHVVTGKVKVF